MAIEKCAKCGGSLEIRDWTKPGYNCERCGRRFCGSCGHIQLDINYFQSYCPFCDSSGAKKNMPTSKVKCKSCGVDILESTHKKYNGNCAKCGMSNNNKSKKGCFIATATFGSYNHPYVLIFRNYRDTVLNKKIIGRFFIAIYYRTSPVFADIIKENKTLKYCSEKFLSQIVRFIKI